MNSTDGIAECPKFNTRKDEKTLMKKSGKKYFDSNGSLNFIKKCFGFFFSLKIP